MVGELDHRANQRLLIILARAPVPGQTKTRLGATIGMERASQLYAGFLTDLATRFSPCHVRRAYAVAWAVTPESQDFPAILRRLTGKGLTDELAFITQCGADFAVRQANLLRWGYQHGYDRTVLLASDSPHLTTQAVTAAFDALDEAEIAIGRVCDGGYYLIGVRGNHDPITGVPMSTPDAANGICCRAQRLGLSVHEVSPTFDVDVEDDLSVLIKTIQPDGKLAPATWTALQCLGLLTDS